MNKLIIAGIIIAAVVISGAFASPLFYDTEIDEPLPIALDDMKDVDEMRDVDVDDMKDVDEMSDVDVDDMKDVDEMRDVDESLSDALEGMQEGLTLEKFGSMDEESRVVIVDAMPQKIKDMIMDESAKTPRVISEEMEEMEDSERMDEMSDHEGAAEIGDSEMSDSEMMDEMSDSTDMAEMRDSDEPQILKTGQFTGLAGHSARGNAKILDVAGSQFLRFENFEVTNGPDLRVYVTHGGDVKQGIQIAKLKGSIGNQNYPLEDIDTDMYDTVVIYCQPFGAYFGEAKLS